MFHSYFDNFMTRDSWKQMEKNTKRDVRTKRDCKANEEEIYLSYIIILTINCFAKSCHCTFNYAHVTVQYF